MAKAIFVHRADSIYDDLPEERYQFPQRYLKRVMACVGDWIAYYHPRGGGPRGYGAIARVQDVIPDPSAPDMYVAVIEAGSYLPFDQVVAHHDGHRFVESSLAMDDGSLNRGRVQWAVRPISDQDFLRLLEIGFSERDAILPRMADEADPPARFGLEDDARAFQPEARRSVEQIVTRPLRDRIFRRQVLEAYGSRCALTGLKFINGRGRAEVEAAHIQPVAEGGPDSVHNGLALSGTVHWMFDRGLIGLTGDGEIAVSRQVNNPEEIWRLMNPSRRARAPISPTLRPHPRYLAWHWTFCFKQ